MEYVVNIVFNYIVEKVYAIKLWNCWELDGDCFYYENSNFFFLLKLIIYVGGEWKGGGLIELLAGLLERSGTRTDRWSIWNLRQSLFHVIILQWL